MSSMKNDIWYLALVVCAVLLVAGVLVYGAYN